MAIRPHLHWRTHRLRLERTNVIQRAFPALVALLLLVMVMLVFLFTPVAEGAQAVEVHASQAAAMLVRVPAAPPL